MADDKPEPIPRKSPKKRSGPSMREQIAARRRAEATGGGDSTPAAKPAPKASAKPAPKARPAAKPKAAAAPKKASGTARPAVKRSGAAGGSRRNRDGDSGEGGGARRSRREKAEAPKKSNLPLIAAGVLVLGGGGAAAYFGGLFGGTTQAAEKDQTEDATTADADGASTSAEGATDGEAMVKDDTAGADDAMAAKDDAMAGKDADMADKGDAMAGKEEAAAEKPKSNKKGLTKYSTEELKAMHAALEPFDRPSSISEEEWTELGKQADLLFVDAGRKSSAAEKALSIDGKREIYPLLINRYIAMDFDDEEAVMGGKLAARVLTAVRGSKNDRFDIGWRTAGESEDGTFGDKELRQDLMIVINFHKSWSKVVADPAHWERIYIGEMYKEAEEIMKESAESKLDELDDLDVDDLDLDDLDG